jgi:nucleoid-associated protein
LTNDVGLPESFPPNQSALRALTKYVGSGGGLTISFDEKLLGERIQYNAQTDTLTVTGLPPNLRDQLLRNNR